MVSRYDDDVSRAVAHIAPRHPLSRRQLALRWAVGALVVLVVGLVTALVARPSTPAGPIGTPGALASPVATTPTTTTDTASYDATDTGTIDNWNSLDDAFLNELTTVDPAVHAQHASANAWALLLAANQACILMTSGDFDPSALAAAVDTSLTDSVTRGVPVPDDPTTVADVSVDATILCPDA